MLRRRGGRNTATPPPSGPTLVQYKAANNRTLTLDSSPTSGNKLWIVFSRNGAGHGSVCATPTGFTRLIHRLDTSNGERGTAQFCKELGAGESATVTVDDPGGSEYELHVMEWANLIDTDTVDQTATATIASAGTNISSGTTGTTTQADEVCVASMMVVGAPIGINPTVNNSFTRQSDIASADRSAVAFRIVTATGTFSTTFDWSGGNGVFATACIATIKAA